METHHHNYLNQIFVKDKWAGEEDLLVYRQLSDDQYILFINKDGISKFYLYDLTVNTLEEIFLPQIDPPQNVSNIPRSRDPYGGLFDPFIGIERQAFYDLELCEVYYSYTPDEIIIYNWKTEKERKIFIDLQCNLEKISKILKNNDYLLFFADKELFVFELTVLNALFDASTEPDTIIVTKDHIYTFKKDIITPKEFYLHSYIADNECYFHNKRIYTDFRVMFDLTEIHKINLRTKEITGEYIPLTQAFTHLCKLWTAKTRCDAYFNSYLVLLDFYEDFISQQRDQRTGGYNYLDAKINLLNDTSIVSFVFGRFIIDNNAICRFIGKEYAQKSDSSYFQYYNIFSSDVSTQETGLIQLLQRDLSAGDLVTLNPAFRFDYKSIVEKYAEFISENLRSYSRSGHLCYNLVSLIRLTSKDFIKFSIELLNKSKAKTLIAMLLLRGRIKPEGYDFYHNDSTDYTHPDFSRDTIPVVFNHESEIPFEEVFSITKEHVKSLPIVKDFRMRDLDLLENIIITSSSWKNSYTVAIFNWIYEQHLGPDVEKLLIRQIADNDLTSLIGILESCVDSGDREIVKTALKAMGNLKIAEAEKIGLKYLRTDNVEIRNAALSLLIEVSTLACFEDMTNLFIMERLKYDDSAPVHSSLEIALAVIHNLGSMDTDELLNYPLSKINNYLLVGYVLLLYHTLKAEEEFQMISEEEFSGIFKRTDFDNYFIDIYNYKNVLKMKKGITERQNVFLNLLPKIANNRKVKLGFTIALILSLKRGFALQGNNNSKQQKLIIYLKEILERSYKKLKGVDKILVSAALLEIGADKKYEKIVKDIISNQDFQDWPYVINILEMVLDYNDPINKLPKIISELENFIELKEKRKQDNIEVSFEWLDTEKEYETRVGSYLIDFLIYHLIKSSHPDLKKFFDLIIKSEMSDYETLAQAGLEKIERE